MQRKLPLIAGMQGAPKPAPHNILRQIASDAQAVAVAIQSGNYKLAFIAASLGVSETYVSRIKNGKRPVPDWFVTPFCIVTGTSLLQQFRDWQEAMREANERDDIARIAAQLRRAA